MKKKTLRNKTLGEIALEPLTDDTPWKKLTLEERVAELELLLLEETMKVDELEEELELLKERPKIIIKEIHHHYPQWNYYPPIQVQPYLPQPFDNYPIVLC